MGLFVLHLQTYQTWNSYSTFNTNILQNLSTTYYNQQNTSFQLKKYNNGTTQDYQLRNITNIVNYNWILTNDDAIYNFDTTFLLQFNFLPGTTTFKFPLTHTTRSNHQLISNGGMVLQFKDH